MEGTRSGSGSVQIMLDPDLRGPKICGSYDSGSGTTTLYQVPVPVVVLARAAFRIFNSYTWTSVKWFAHAYWCLVHAWGVR
jgi:hypothetical protein